MYNRYIPGADGTFQRTVVDDRPPKPQPVPEAAPPATEQVVCIPQEPAPQPDAPCNQALSVRTLLKKLLPRGVELDDLLVLLIILLLLVDGDQEDTLALLVTAAAFLLL